MRVWTVTFQELGSSESVLVERDEVGNWVHLVFADTEQGYQLALEKFAEYREERLSFHSLTVEGTFGPDARAHLVAREATGHEDCCMSTGDVVSLRPYDVIGG